MPMCRCPKCRGYSDTDQALMFVNHLWRVIRGVDPRARLAHLTYANTLEPPARPGPADDPRAVPRPWSEPTEQDT